MQGAGEGRQDRERHVGRAAAHAPASRDPPPSTPRQHAGTVRMGRAVGGPLGAAGFVSGVYGAGGVGARPVCTGQGREVRPVCTGQGGEARPVRTGWHPAIAAATSYCCEERKSTSWCTPYDLSPGRAKSIKRFKRFSGTNECIH